MENKIEIIPENLIENIEKDITSIIIELNNYSLQEYVELLNGNKEILKKVKKYAFDSLIEKISSKCDFDISEYLIDRYRLNNKKIDEQHYFDKDFNINIQKEINKYIEEKIVKIKNKYSNYDDFYISELKKAEKENNQVKEKVKILENKLGEDKIDDELEDYYNDNVSESSTEICKLYKQSDILENKIINLTNCIKIVVDFDKTYQNSNFEFDYESIGKFKDDGYSQPDIDYEYVFDGLYCKINNYSDYLTANLSNKLIKNKNKFIKLNEVFEIIIKDINDDKMISFNSKKTFLEGINELIKQVKQEKNKKIKNKK